MTKKKQNVFLFFFVSIIFLIATYNNRFPNDYFFASGDVFEILNNSYYEWKNYGYWRFSNFGFVDTDYIWKFYYQLIDTINNFSFKFEKNFNNLYIKFIFLFLSFYSFYFCIKNLDIKIENYLLILLCFSFTCNFFVFFIFWYTWGYTPTIFAYFTIPFIFTSYIKFLKLKKLKQKIKYLFIISPIFFFSNIAYANIAWYLITVILIVLYFSLNIFISRNKIFSKKNLIDLNCSLLFGLFFTIFVLPSILPSIFSLFNVLSVGTGYSFSSIISAQAQALPSIFFISQQIFSVNNMSSLQFLSIFNFIIFFYFLFFLKKFNNNQLIFIFIIFLFVFFSFKGFGILPVKFVNEFFSKSIWYAFRSEDKVSFFIPFLLLIFISYAIEKQSYKIRIYTTVLLFVTNILSSYPILTGKLQTKYGLLIEENSSFKEEEIAMLKKFPNDYIQVIKILNDQKNLIDYNVLDAPFSVTRSYGWNEYKLWQHVGTSPYDHLIKMQVINMNSDYNIFKKHNINTSRAWSHSDKLSAWDLNFLSNNSIKYIIVHKDVHFSFLTNFLKKIRKLEENKIIKKIYTGRLLNLYQVSDQYLNQKIYIPNKIFRSYYYDIYYEYLNDKSFSQEFNTSFINSAVTFNNSDVPQHNYKIINLNNLNIVGTETFRKEMKNYEFEEVNKLANLRLKGIKKFNIENIKFDKINGYNFNVKNLSKIRNSIGNFYLAFSQKYNRFWKLECLNCDNKTKIVHFAINENLNGWRIEQNTQEELNFKLIFKPNQYIKLIWILLIFLCLSIFLIGKKIRK